PAAARALAMPPAAAGAAAGSAWRGRSVRGPRADGAGDLGLAPAGAARPRVAAGRDARRRGGERAGPRARPRAPPRLPRQPGAERDRGVVLLPARTVAGVGDGPRRA